MIGDGRIRGRLPAGVIGLVIVSSSLGGCGEIPEHASDHASVGCYGCHGDRYLASTQPDHVASGFPTRCEDCHSTHAWEPAAFGDHASWPLTGAHVTAACESCHGGGVYSGTPRECVGCHRPDYETSTNPSHPALAMPTECQSCHTPASWASSTYPGHDAFFRISGGDHRFSCESCHLTERWASFTCTGCHTGEHDLARMNREHDDEDGYQATLSRYGVDAGCLHCHPGGRED